jgi:uncharacterized protein (DUF924 family)
MGEERLAEVFAPMERMFLFLPLDHHENKESVQEAIRSMETLQVYTTYASIVSLGIQSMKDHLYLLDKYGRYPYRNVILGRQSTAEEEAYLRTPKEGYEAYVNAIAS